MDFDRDKRALIVDDEPSICDSLGGVLEDEGWRVQSSPSGLDGIKRFKYFRPDIVFLDVWMTGLDGVETLQRLKELTSDVPIVIMSGHGSIETAVKVTKLGAFDFLEKPLSVDKVIPMLEHAVQMKNIRLKGGVPEAKGYDLIGESPAMQKLRRQIELVAPRNAWVLITGENGTGKEVVARNIHFQSSRATKPFVAINCAAIPEELIESELFGHVKGAFTGAVSSKKGKFELADQGTLFLDEIADMSLRTQAKILRILQEKQFERIGDDETIEVDVRVIAATNKDLPEEIAKGNFREDLYYRLNVVPFHLAPLRERGDDVLLLADFFLKKVAGDFGDTPKTLAPDVLRAFRNYSWPGNVRQLQNLIERVCVMCESPMIEQKDLPEALRQITEDAGLGGEDPLDASTLKEARNEFERRYILEKLQENQWNVSRTAEAIGIERSNLHRKLKSFQIDPKRLKC